LHESLTLKSQVRIVVFVRTENEFVNIAVGEISKYAWRALRNTRGRKVKCRSVDLEWQQWMQRNGVCLISWHLLNCFCSQEIEFAKWEW